MVWHSHQAVVCWHCWLNRRPIRSRSGAQHKGGLFTVATFPKKTRPLNRLESDKTPERKNPPEGGFFGGFKDCVGCLWNLVCCRHQESNSGPTDYKSVALPTELYRRYGRRVYPDVLGCKPLITDYFYARVSGPEKTNFRTWCFSYLHRVDEGARHD